mmetsp:Transcript_116869/g.201958  ORF Transcript_116869/g.201958 Transcript_116869/m.201958 type:complete len:1461 (-) Transcript_116869:100-4482(-)
MAMASDSQSSTELDASALEVLASEATAASSRLLLVGLDAITVAVAPPLSTSVAEYLFAPPPVQPPRAKGAARAKKRASKAKKKRKAVVRLPPPPMPPAGTTAHTAARMLSCLRTVQQRSQRTRWQDRLLGLVHQFYTETREAELGEKPAEAAPSERPRTPDILSTANARNAFWQPVHSDCWRKCEPSRGGSLLASPTSTAASKEHWAKLRTNVRSKAKNGKKGELPPVQAEVRMRRPPLGAGFKVLASFRTGEDGSLNRSASDTKLLSLKGAVDMMKEEGLWQDPLSSTSTARSPPPGLPPLKGSLSLLNEESTELPAQASAELTLTAATSLSQESARSAELRLGETLDFTSGPPSQFQSSRSKSVVELFPRLARAKAMPSRRITFGAHADGEIATDKPPETMIVPHEAKGSTASTPCSMHRNQAQKDFEWTLVQELEDLREMAEDDEEPEPPRGPVKHPPRWTRTHSMLEKVQSVGAGARGFASMGPGRTPSIQMESGKMVGTAQSAYMASCFKDRVLPRAPRSLVKAVVECNDKKKIVSAAGSGELGKRSSFGSVVLDAMAAQKHLNLDVASYGVGDSGLRALGESMEHLGPVKVLNLAGNKLSCKAVSDFLLTRMPASGGSLKELNLSRTQTLGVGTWTTLTQMLLDDKLRVLEALRLSEVNIPVQRWEPLMNALLSAGSLRLLDVSDTRLGFSQQGPVAAVANLAAHGVLTDLDMSCNFVYREGAEALVNALDQTLHLTTLDLSHNAGDHITGLTEPPSPRAARAAAAAIAEEAADDEAEEDGPEPTAKELEEAAAAAAAEAALYAEPPPFSPLLLIIEGLLRNTTLCNLSLVHCSLEYAADFMLGEVLASHPRLSNLNVSSNPHGVDGLGCLLRGIGLSPIGADVKVDVMDLRDCAVAATATKYNFGDPSRMYILHMPHPQHRSVLRTLLDRPKIGGKESRACFQDIQYVYGSLLPGMWSFGSIQKEGEHWKVPNVGALRFTYNGAVPATPRGETGPLGKAQDAYRRGRVPLGLTRSIALVNAYGTCRTDTQRILFLEGVANSMLLKTAHVRLFVWHSPATLGVEVVRLLFPAVGDLGETLPMEVLRNRQESSKVRADIRNVCMLNLRNPTGRYTLQLSNPCDRACVSRLQAVSAFEQQLQKAEGRPDVSQHGNYEPVRNLQHNGHSVLAGEQIAQFADLSVPSGGVLVLDYASRARALRRGALIENVRTSDKVLGEVHNVISHSRATWSETLQTFRATVADRMAFTVADVRSFVQLFAGLAQANEKREKSGRNTKATYRPAHVEALLACFGRCLEPSTLASKALLHDPKLFTPEEATEFRIRLGSVNVFDWAHFGEPDAHMPHGNKYSLDLTLHEDRQVAKYLLSVAKRENKESHECLNQCLWDEEEIFDENDGDQWQPEWMADMPQEGIFTCEYNDEEGVEVDAFSLWSPRREFGERVLGADIPPPPRRISSA